MSLSSSSLGWQRRTATYLLSDPFVFVCNTHKLRYLLFLQTIERHCETLQALKPIEVVILQSNHSI